MKIVEQTHIYSPDKKDWVPMELYDFQKYYLSVLRSGRDTICFKSRQMGFSVIHSAYALEHCLTGPGRDAFILALRVHEAENIIKRIRQTYKRLDSQTKDVVEVTRDNRYGLTFSNGSSVHAIPMSPSALHSTSASLIIFEEPAFEPSFEDTWRAVWPQLRAAGQMVISSSGRRGFFQKLWEDSVAGRIGLKPVKFPWYFHPERGPDWVQDISRQCSLDSFRLEFLCEFP